MIQQLTMLGILAGSVWSHIPLPHTHFCGRLAQIKMGEGTSPDLSWCESDGFCANIFWSSQWKTDLVFVLPGIQIARAKLPISCSEAFVDVISFSMTEAPKRVKPHAPFRPSNAKVVDAPLHYHAEFRIDNRPRVKIEFLVQNRFVSYSLLLDTASNRAHMESVPCQRGSCRKSLNSRKSVSIMKPYRDKGFSDVPNGAETLVYGASTLSALEQTKTVRELASIPGKPLAFSFALTLGLTGPADDPYMGVGLLGAARTSHFAIAAGVFAWVPASPIKSAKDAGNHLIGDRDWTEVCPGGYSPIFLAVRSDVSPLHWVVAGSVRIGDAAPVHTDWVIDTGANGLTVPYEAYMRLKRALAERGAHLEQEAPGRRNRIIDCRNYKTRFPTVRLEAEDQIGYFSLSFTPDMYISQVFGNEHSCTLKFVHHGIDQNMPSAALLSAGFLERVTSIYDVKRERVGFCN